MTWDSVKWDVVLYLFASIPVKLSLLELPSAFGERLAVDNASAPAEVLAAVKKEKDILAKALNDSHIWRTLYSCSLSAIAAIAMLTTTKSTTVQTLTLTIALPIFVVMLSTIALYWKVTRKSTPHPYSFSGEPLTTWSLSLSAANVLAILGIGTDVYFAIAKHV